MESLITAGISIVSLSVGWLLNELSNHLKKSGEHKAAIASALTLLLDVRYQIYHFHNVILLLKETGAEADQTRLVRKGMGELMPCPEKTIEAYDKAIELVSRKNPLLAYEFRNRCMSLNLVSKWSEIAEEYGLEDEQIEEYITKMSSFMMPALDDLVLTLAKSHSRKAFKETKVHVDIGVDLPSDLGGLFPK